MNFELEQSSFRNHLVKSVLSLGHNQSLLGEGGNPESKDSHKAIHLIHVEFAIHQSPFPILLLGESPSPGFEYRSAQNEVPLIVEPINVSVRGQGRGMDGLQINQFLGWNPQLKEVPLMPNILDLQ